jgi:hypothetical protein
MGDNYYACGARSKRDNENKGSASNLIVPIQRFLQISNILLRNLYLYLYIVNEVVATVFPSIFIFSQQKLYTQFYYVHKTKLCEDSNKFWAPYAVQKTLIITSK